MNPMMKKLIALIINSILACNFLMAQVNLFKTYDTIQYQHVIKDDGFYMAGYYHHYPNREIILQKTDQAGDINWIKQFNYEDYLTDYDFIKTRDGDFVILGVESFKKDGYPSDTSSNIYLIKTDPAGDTIWTSKIDINKFDYGYSIIETNDNGYLITGSLRETSSTSGNDILIAKLNSEGKLLWWKTFGFGESDCGHDIVAYKDSNYYVTGQLTDEGSGILYAFLMNVNVDGDSIWLKRYDFYESVYGKNLIMTNDTGFIILVNNPWLSKYPRLIKTDLAGDTTWTKNYDLGNGDEMFSAITPTFDNGCLVGGYTEGADVRPPWSQMAVCKLDHDGSVVWYKKYLENIWTDKIFKTVNFLSETEDGYIVLGRNTTLNKTHLFKIDLNGCYLQSPLIYGSEYFCTADSTKLFTNSAYNSLTWSTGSHSEEIYVDSAGKYHLTIIDTNNCQIRSDTMDIIEHIPPELSIETDQPATICSGDSVILTATVSNYDPLLNYNYAWNDGQFNGHEVVAYSPGIYSLLVEDGFCSSSDSLEVIVQYPFQEKICIVTVDRSTGRNLVVWERTPGKGSAYYNIYREDQPIGLVPYSDLSVYLDMTADPEKRPYIYQISTVDTCGNESELSPYHKPHFLQFVSADGGVNLEWDDYLIAGDSVNFVNYTIYRGGDAVGLSPLEENIPKIIHNYTDNDQSTRTTKYFYRIAGNLLNACYPSSDKKADPGPYSHSMSNIEENRLQNHYPTDIMLDNNSLDENQPEFSLVGRFTAIDQDTADQHLFTFIEGEGDDNNTVFSIRNDSLFCLQSLDYEIKNHYSIRIQCKEDGTDSLTFEKIFTITINDMVEAGFKDVYCTSLTIYPNPFSHTATIRFSNTEKTKYQLYVRDLSGKLVRTRDDILTDKVEFLRAELPAGVYFVELRGEHLYRGKLIIE
jgi:hypothetical protein